MDSCRVIRTAYMAGLELDTMSNNSSLWASEKYPFKILCVHPTMMPLAPTPVAAVPSKPKIGFSIDSIVGGGTRTQSVSPRSDGDNSNHSVLSDSPASSPHRGHRTTAHSSPPSPSPSLSPVASPTLDPGRASPGPPTIVRPSALPPGALPPFKYHLPDHLVHGHHHQLALAAAAAQHFQAANLAAALGNGSFMPPGGPQGHAPNGPPQTGPQLMPPTHHHPQPPRDTYPLYPWLLSRHGRIFPHRFPGGKGWSTIMLPNLLGKKPLQN